MMRRLMLILGSMVLAAVAFLTYMVWQSPGGAGGKHDDTHLQPTTLQTSEGVIGVGAGQGVWIKQYDKDGQLSSVLRASRYVPREGGNVVDVIEPESEFFLSGGRRMVISGDRGVVNVEQRPSAAKSGIGAGAGEAAPTSGVLYNVVIRVFDPQTPDRPTLTLNTHNISFDNQTFKIATEKFVDSYGQSIPADAVPVTIRGDDVDFDGRGLIARYDDLNQRIAMLQITHGDQMTLKRSELLPGDRRKPEKAERPTSTVTPATAVSSTPKPLTPPSAAVATDTAKPKAPPATTGRATTRPGNGPTIYRATFTDAVRVTQGDAPMAEADVLAIEFFPQTSKRDAATKPATQPARPATSPTTQTVATAPATSPASQASTAPTTQPTSQPAPVMIRWTGPLRIVAIDEPTVPLEPGQSSVTASGAPLVLHQPQGVVRSGSVLFQSKENAVRLLASSAVPVVTFTDSTGQTSLRTERMEYSDAAKTATLLGPSELRMIQPAEGNQPATETIANWKDRCDVKLFAGNSAIRQVDLTGDVDVKNPRLKMKSSTLSLAFKPDAKDKDKTNLDRITATGNVDCDLSEPGSPNRTLRGEKVVVSTTIEPDGTVFAQRIDAAGSVRASDGEQSLAADTVLVTLAPKPPTTRPSGEASARSNGRATTRAGTTSATRPATRPASDAALAARTELKTFRAAGSVMLLTQDSKAAADEVTIAQTDGRQVIELRGEPAMLSQQGRTITGAVITARPDEGIAKIDGAGTLQALEAVAPKAGDRATTRPTSRPIDLAWGGGAELDAGKNLATFRDSVAIKTVESDGTKRTATADLMTITLKPAATTQPTKNRSKAATKPAATQPTDAFKDKTVSAVTLAGNVNVETTLESKSGELIKRSLLQTERLIANLDDAQQLASIDIPVAGRAMMDDRSNIKETKKDGAGATAVAWGKSFRLEQGANPVATLLGDVHVHHDPPTGPGQDSVDLRSSKIIITFAPEAKRPTTRPAGVAAATRPATRPATQPTTRAAELAIGVKQIYAAAPVQFKAHDLSVTAQALQYTPDNHTVLVSGTDRQPVEWFDGENRAKGQFQQIWYNTETQLVERWTGVNVQGGR